MRRELEDALEGRRGGRRRGIRLGRFWGPERSAICRRAAFLVGVHGGDDFLRGDVGPRRERGEAAD